MGSMQLGYNPKIWRESKVIFIPKAGKKSYTTTNAFRPISLMQFLYKINEKIIAIEIEE